MSRVIWTYTILQLHVFSVLVLEVLKVTIFLEKKMNMMVTYLLYFDTEHMLWFFGPAWGDLCQAVHMCRVATVREKYLENEFFSSSGKCQGILWMAREI